MEKGKIRIIIMALFGVLAILFRLLYEITQSSEYKALTLGSIVLMTLSYIIIFVSDYD